MVHNVAAGGLATQHRSRIGSKFLMNVAATSRRRLKGLIPAVLNYGRRTFTVLICPDISRF
jgi:hypothetical protein